MSRRYVLGGALAVAVASSSLLSAPAWADSMRAVEPAPSASSLVSATNAMLRPGDVVDTLVLPMPSYLEGFTNGFTNPPYVLDAPAVCSPGPDYNPVEAPSDRATGFTARSGLVSQYVYKYVSEAEAQGAWAKLSDEIANRCTGMTSGDSSVRISAERMAGIDEPGWAVTGSGYGSAYATVHLVGDAIQLVSFNGDGQAVSSGAAGAVRELAVVLALRWLGRATLPITQDPALTRAEGSMLQLGDMPSALPVLPPQAGGGSGFNSNQPGSEMLSPCYLESARTIAGGDASFVANFGGAGAVTTTPEGSVYQWVSVFATPSAAQESWELLSQQAKRCSRGLNEPVAGNKNLQRATNGLSELSFGGVPGIWVRQLMTDGQGTLEDGSRFEISEKAYSIYLLMGNAIQQVTYVAGRSGLGQVPLDQLAVNQLAQDLANRWVAAGAQ